ncbi:MAG: hypothetical protein HDR75_01790 [Bacteroides sp.]|nr:hypothetical protein [Bacteroides sp.]
MVNQDVITYFKNNWPWTPSMLSIFDSMTFYSSKCPIEFKRQFRNNFGVDEDEELIYCRDTSFWNDKNQGCVITDWGVYIIVDNDDPNSSFNFSWAEIDHVTYNDDVFFFWLTEDNDINNCYRIHQNFFSKNDVAKHVFQRLAQHFTDIAQLVQPQKHPLLVAIDRMYSDDTSAEEADRIGREILGVDPYYDDIIHYHLGVNAYLNLKDNEKALKHLNTALQITDDDGNWRYRAHYILGIILSQTSELESPELRQHIFMASKASPDMIVDSENNLSMADDSINDLQYLETNLASTGYKDLSYDQKKIIYPVDKLWELSNLSQTQVRPVLLSAVKASESLQFPLGHPVANETYICHPYNQQKYLLFENYEVELLEDKLREYCEIMQALGATEIEVKVERSSSEDSSSKSSRDISGKVDSMADFSGSANLQDTSSERTHWERTFNRKQHFKPTTKIAVPENTVWLAGEPGWQRTINQRLAGNLLSHHESISTKTSRLVSGTSAKTFKAEMESLFVDLGLTWSQSDEFTYSNQTNLSLSIDVKFGDTKTAEETPQTSGFSDAEKEYLEEYKLCLNDGSVSTSERRLLNRLANSLGLTEEQVQQIENSLSPQLSDEEKEYLAEYKLCLADGEITPSARRLLDRMAKSLNLTPQQIQTLESLN